MKEIAYSKSALKVLRKMANNEAIHIRQKIEQYAADPASLANNVKALTGSPYIRLRVGDWRVIMDEQGAVLNVLKLALAAAFTNRSPNAKVHHPRRGNTGSAGPQRI